MRIHIREESVAAVVQVSGDVDMSTSPRLREALLELLRDSPRARVVVDLEAVDYIDSSGIASLVEGLQEARKRRARFILAALNEGPRYVLELTRLLDVFEVHASVGEALSA